MVTRVASLAAEILSDVQAGEFDCSDETVEPSMRDEREQSGCGRSEIKEENAGAEESLYREGKWVRWDRALFFRSLCNRAFGMLNTVSRVALELWKQCR